MESVAQQILSQTSEQNHEPVSGDGEGKVEQSAEAPKSEDPKLSLIAKLERKIKLQEEQLKKEKQELEQKYQRLKALEEFDSEFEKNPLSALQKKGYDLERLNKWAIENLSEDDLDPVAKKFKEFEIKIEKTKEELRKEYEEKIRQKEEEIRNKDYEAQVNQFKLELKSYLSANKDKYELINAEDNGYEIVFDVIREDLVRQAESGKNQNELVPMSIEEAADRVESFLDSQVKKYLNLNKYKSRNDDDSLRDYIGKLSSAKTIDSNFSPKSQSVDELSEQERIKAAIELVKRGFQN